MDLSRRTWRPSKRVWKVSRRFQSSECVSSSPGASRSSLFWVGACVAGAGATDVTTGWWTGWWCTGWWTGERVIGCWWDVEWMIEWTDGWVWVYG